MKAAVVREFGQPLVMEDRPIPSPGFGQVTAEAVYAALHPGGGNAEADGGAENGRGQATRGDEDER